MLCIISLSIIRLAIAAPVNNTTDTTQSSFVGYVSEPNVRGTTSLLISCLLTLILCVWSALHLNVPAPGESRLQCLLCNMRWIITGVYAPELVVFTAWRQWASARLLGQLISSLAVKESKEPLKAETPPVLIDASFDASPATSIRKTMYKSSTFAARKHRWTKTHDFFACTGGFAFETTPRESRKEFLPAGCPSRLTLTARGVALLAKCDRLPDVSEKDILDKSKANDLAKALVVIQACWMVIQTMGRIIVGLPVTLLEVNTMAHVACVFVMYVLWWNKPLLPNEPFILTGGWVEPLCAYMYMSSDISGEVDIKESQTFVKTLFASLNWYSKVPEIEHVSLRVSKATSAAAAVEATESSEHDEEGASHTFQGISTSSSCLEQLRLNRLEKATDTAFFERRPKVKARDLSMSSTSPTTQHRWTLTLRAINEYPVLTNEHILLQHSKPSTCKHFKSEELLVRRVQNWPSNDLLRNVGGLTVGMVLWLASFCYGGIHAAAWNVQFPSDAEKWLWRASATYIGFCGGLWIVLNYVAQAYQPMNEFWEAWMDGKSHWYLNVIIGALVLVCGVSFCVARCYIVIEAVISIRWLPAAAYQTPDWTQVFPHL